MQDQPYLADLSAFLEDGPERVNDFETVAFGL
jgi:hypothetical protein